jgi:hypothetical protein
MSAKKRSASEMETDVSTSGMINKRGPGGKRTALDNDEMGDFEDEWEDEVEGDENVQEDAKIEEKDGIYGFLPENCHS